MCAHKPHDYATKIKKKWFIIHVNICVCVFMGLTMPKILKYYVSNQWGRVDAYYCHKYHHKKCHYIILSLKAQTLYFSNICADYS